MRLRTHDEFDWPNACNILTFRFREISVLYARDANLLASVGWCLFLSLRSEELVEIFTIQSIVVVVVVG